MSLTVNPLSAVHGKGQEGRSSLPCPCHNMADKWWGQFSHVHSFGLACTFPHSQGWLYCASQMRCRVTLPGAQVVRGKNSSPTLMISGPGLLPATVWEQLAGRKVSLPHTCHHTGDTWYGQVLGSALLFACTQSQFSHGGQVRGEANSAQPSFTYMSSGSSPD